MIAMLVFKEERFVFCDTTARWNVASVSNVAQRKCTEIIN